jgi:hypothetical protein
MPSKASRPIAKLAEIHRIIDGWERDCSGSPAAAMLAKELRNRLNGISGCERAECQALGACSRGALACERDPSIVQKEHPR